MRYDVLNVRVAHNKQCELYTGIILLVALCWLISLHYGGSNFCKGNCFSIAIVKSAERLMRDDTACHVFIYFLGVYLVVHWHIQECLLAGRTKEKKNEY